ncbi:uncharacterized protein DUF4349 [Mucilaginibacter gracilis]|uniref:Uncharacterized protein DUF4349 n=1 Tax=Mucilaginibacter gracilis TaxID=423350 RepID=A0A495IYN4_9SPHI|nr:DUF4349 domain-containing protein [Mucilaginibacter gracilis]RKR81682.1 uncharacterized protein DUF4349 [Mucilaginibacter gracilis]
MKKQHFACMGLLCTIFWAGCSGSKSHSELSSADTTAAISNLDTAAKQVKLVKTANMHFKVKDVKSISQSITALTAKYKGMVMHHSMQAYTGRSERVPQGSDSVMLISSCITNADMVVRIPSGDVDAFLNQVGGMAVYVNSRNMDIEDKALDYLAAQMKFLSRSEFIAQQKKGIIKVKNPADVMNLKDDLIDQQIDNKRIDNAVKYSTVGLNFYQSNTIAREVVVNDDPSNFKLPFFGRLGYALANGWSIFIDAVIAMANLWMFAVAAIAIWVLYKYFKKKNAIAAM